MEIKCINCGQTCEVDEEPVPGQHLLCPFCDMKFSYTPQNTSGDNADGISSTAVEPQDEESPANVTTSCPHCGAKYEVETVYIDETATCGTCGNEFIVKAVEMSSESDASMTDEPIPAAPSKKNVKGIYAKAKLSANTTKCKPKRDGKRNIIVSGIAALAALCCALYFSNIRGKDTANGVKDKQPASPAQVTEENCVSSTKVNHKEATRTQLTGEGEAVSAKENRRVTITLPPGAPSELLLKYAEMGETDYIKAVLEQNPTLDVNRPRATGNKTALYLACENGFSDIVELLLRKNADATICDTIPRSFTAVHNYSPLTIAAKNGHLATLKVLLASGKVDIESRDENNRTALYAAAANNKPEVVKFLCQSKAKVNIQGVNKWTPLTVAADQGCTDVVTVLLQYGDKPDLEMPGGWPSGTPLLHAVNKNHPKVVEILCKAKAKVNVHCPLSNLTPLMKSVDNEYTEVVKALLKYGDGLNLEIRGGPLSETVLHRAVSKNNPEIVELLCKAGANVHAETGTYLGDLTTPLGRARHKGYAEVVKILERYK